MRLNRPLAAALTLAGALALTLAPAWSASAGDSSTTHFAKSATQTVPYGTNWLMRITVTGEHDYDTISPSSGTVNVLIKGLPGNYATGLPLTDGGVAYFSPPSDLPPLGAGTYSVSAVYVPSGTAYVNASQTLVPATITITPLTLTTSISVNKTTVKNVPALQVVAAINQHSPNSAIPDGSWHITATDPSGATAFAATVPLSSNHASPVRVTLGQKVRAGIAYTLSATFTPASNVADGYRVVNPGSKTVTVQSQSVSEILSTPLAEPFWLVGAIGLGIAALIVAGVVVFISDKPKSTLAAPEAASHAASTSE
jgi:hypothetical protein